MPPALSDPDFEGGLDDLQALQPYQFCDSVTMPSATQLAQDRVQLEMSAENSGSQDLTVHPEATRRNIPVFPHDLQLHRSRTRPLFTSTVRALSETSGLGEGCAWKFFLCQEPAGGSDSAQQQLPGDALPSHSVRVPSTGGPAWPPPKHPCSRRW